MAGKGNWSSTIETTVTFQVTVKFWRRLLRLFVTFGTFRTFKPFRTFGAFGTFVPLGTFREFGTYGTFETFRTLKTFATLEHFGQISRRIIKRKKKVALGLQQVWTTTSKLNYIENGGIKRFNDHVDRSRIMKKTALRENKGSPKQTEKKKWNFQVILM